MDAFEINKMIGGVLFALLVFFATKTISEIVFRVPAPEKLGYAVAIDEAEEAAEGAGDGKTEVSLAALLQQGDAARGERVAKKCAVCHTFDAGGKAKTGPNLHDIVGRPKAQTPGFEFSNALKAKGGTWTYEDLDAFIARPQDWLPGTKMVFAGIKRADQRADLILYLRSITDDAPPLPEVTESAEADKAAEGEAPKAVAHAEPAAPEASEPAGDSSAPASAEAPAGAEGQPDQSQAVQPQ